MGETGSHQAGILLPKQSREIMDFFPVLDSFQKNPRERICFIDRTSGKCWFFNLIYYNNKFYGGTRNEYRLTGMTPFFKFNELRSRDEVVFEKYYEVEEAHYSINFLKRDIKKKEQKTSILKLSSNWRIIKIKSR